MYSTLHLDSSMLIEWLGTKNTPIQSGSRPTGSACLIVFSKSVAV